MNQVMINYQSVIAIYSGEELYFENLHLIRNRFKGMGTHRQFLETVLSHAEIDFKAAIESKDHVFNLHIPMEGFESQRMDIVCNGEKTIFELMSLEDSVNRLVDSNQMHSILFRESNMPVLLIDPLNGDIISASKAAKDFYGYVSDGVVYQNMKWINLLPPEEIELEMRRAMEGNRDYYNFRHRIANGEIRNVEVYSNPITISGRQYMMAFVLDITKRDQGQRMMMEEFKKYEMVFNAMSEGVFIAQADEHLRVSRFEDVNQAAVNRLGYTRNELIKMNPADIDVGMNKERYYELIAYLKKYGRHSFYVDQRKKDGGLLHSLVTSSVFEYYDKNYLVSIVLDMTDFARVQREKHMESKRLIRLFETIDEAAFILDDEGQVMSINVRAFEMFGYTSDELQGQPLVRFLTDEATVDSFEANLERIQNAQFDSFTGTRRTKFGTSIKIQVKAFAYHNALGEREMILLYRELDDHAKMDAQLRSYEEIFDQAAECVLIADASQKIRWANKAIRGFLGKDLSELTGKHPSILFKESDLRLPSGQSMEKIIQQGQYNEMIELMSHDGRRVNFDLRIMPIRQSGSQLRYAAIMSDITKQLHLDQAFSDLRRRHSVTGFFTREYLEEIKESILYDMGDSMAVALLNLNDFRILVNLKGHTFGDKLVRVFADLIRDCLGKMQMFTFGRDQLLAVSSNGPELVKGLEEVMACVKQPLVVDGIPLNLTISVGYSVRTEDDASLNDLIRRADIALDRAKHASGSRIERFMEAPTSNGTDLLTQLRTAVERGEIHPVYQAIHNLSNRAIVGYEMLLRWEDKAGRHFSPEVFIPVLERHGGFEAIEPMIIKRAVEDLVNRLDQEGTYLSMNVSLVQLLDNTVLELIMSQCRRWDIPFDRIHIEVRAEDFYGGGHLVMGALESFRDAGFNLVLDRYQGDRIDIGLMASDLFTRVKWDVAWIVKACRTPEHRGLIKGIINAFSAMGVINVAVAVEDAGVCELIQELGFDECQGFYLCRTFF